MEIKKIHLPKMGESVAEATIIKWHKKVGDKIERDEIFVEIGTDKVDSELPSTHEGILKEIFVKDGETVATGTVICSIEIDGKATESVIRPKEEKETSIIETTAATTSQESKALNKTTEEGIFLSPVVRKMVAEHKISTSQLASINGSGQNNRITKKDIESFLLPTLSPRNVGARQNESFGLGMSAGQGRTGIYIPPKRDLKIEDGDDVQTLSRIRQVIAKNMLESVQTIPHVTTVVEVDVSEMVYLREQGKATFQETHGTKITYTHILMHAIVSVLHEFPKINAWMNGNDELIIKKHVALGFAAALPDGNLVVPNIKHAEELSLVGLVKEVNDVANKAKAGQLPGDTYTNTTFTVSNTGIFGSQFGTPIISVPQVAVLALGAIEKKAAVFLQDNKEHMAIRNMMHLSLSYDHRVIDGAYASKFLSAIKNKLEHLKSLQ